MSLIAVLLMGAMVLATYRAEADTPKSEAGAVI